MLPTSATPSEPNSRNENDKFMAFLDACSWSLLPGTYSSKATSKPQGSASLQGADSNAHQIKDCKAGDSDTKVEYTFGYKRCADGKPRIHLHHSSVPYSAAPAAVTEAEVLELDGRPPQQLRATAGRARRRQLGMQGVAGSIILGVREI